MTKGEVQLKDNNRDLIVTSAGLRPSIPFAIGGVQLNLLGDVAYHRFHKDKAAEGSLVINNQGVANLYGKELKKCRHDRCGITSSIYTSIEYESRLSR